MKNIGWHNLHDFIAEFILMRLCNQANVLDNTREKFLVPIGSRPTYDPPESMFSEIKDAEFIGGYINTKVIEH